MKEKEPKKAKEADSITASIDAQVAKLEQDTAVISNAISSVESESKHVLAEFNQALTSVGAQAEESFSRTARSLKFYLWTVLIFWILGGVGIGYVLWHLTSYLVAFAVFWAVLGLSVLWNTRNERFTLQANEKMLRANLPKDARSTERPPNKGLGLPYELSLAQSLSKTIQDSFGRVAKEAVLLTPKVSQMIALRTLKLKQAHFIDDFSFAMSRYRVVLDYSDIQALLTRKFWIYDDETLWLADSIDEVRKYLTKSSVPVLKLIYYDSTNQSERIDPAWQEIRTNSALRIELASLLIKKNLLDAANLNDESVEPLSELLESGVKDYTLGKASIVATEFFDSLTEYKNDVVTDLAIYGLEVKDDRKELMVYMPKTALPKLWRNAVLDFTAPLVKLDPLMVKLLVRDIQGDRGRLDAWREIVRMGQSESEESRQKSNNLVQALAVTLSLKRIQKPFIEFRDDVFLRHLVLALKSFPDDFSPAKVEAEVRLIEDQILRTTRNIETTAKRYKLKLSDLSLDDFPPQDVNKIEDELVSTAASKSDVDRSLFEILYYSIVLPERADRLFLELKGKTERESRLNLVSEFLLRKHFVPPTQFSDYLPILLRTQDEFNLTILIQLYFSYERLYRSSNLVYDFLANNQVLADVSRPELTRILEICPPSDDEFENLLVRIGQTLVRGEVKSRLLSPSEKDDLASAAVVLSLKSQNDLRYKQLCMTLAGHRLAPRILYEYANVDRNDPNQTLANAVERALAATRADERHFAGFVTQMESGLLPLRIGNLLEVQISEVTTSLAEWERKVLLTEEDKQFRAAISDLFNDQINEEIVKELLTQQIVSAYIITDPSNNALIKLLEDKESIRKSEESFPNSEPGFNGLVRTKKGSGKATRIGIVPFGMPFEEFSDKLESVLEKAVKIHNKEFPNDAVQDPLPCYALRIFPSEHGLKEIMFESETAETRPVALVRELMDESMSTNNEIKILSLVQSAKTGYEGFKSVIRAVVNNERSNILSLVGATIDSFLATSPELKRWFARKEIDAFLYKLYSSEKLAELCVKISKETRTAGGESLFKSNLRNEVPISDKLTSGEVDSVIDSVLDRLRNIGIALTA
jgi:hypothetical protein